MVEPRAQNLNNSSQEATWHSNDPQVCLTTLPENSKSQESGQNFRATPGTWWAYLAPWPSCRSLQVFSFDSSAHDCSQEPQQLSIRYPGERLLGLSFGRTHQHPPRDQQGLAERSEVSSGFLLQRKESLMPRQTHSTLRSRPLVSTRIPPVSTGERGAPRGVEAQAEASQSLQVSSGSV